MPCEVCTVGRNIYKCPRCLIHYCSLGCWNKHKEVNCQPALNNKKSNESECLKKLHSYKYMTDSSVPVEKLKRLEGGQELKTILSNPHLRNMILAVDRSENPAESMQSAMLEPIFVEFADECLNILEPCN